MKRYGFRVKIVVGADDPEIAQKELEKFLDSSHLEYEVEDGPDDLDEYEDEDIEV